MTPKQRDVCKFYAQHGSARQACLDAGYSELYATRKSAALMKRPEIITEIKRIRARLNEQAEKSATDVVNEFSKIAFTDRVSFLKEDPHRPGEFIYKAPDELTADQRAIVERVTYTTVEASVVENGKPTPVWVKHYNYVIADKSKALEQMGRHFGIFDDKIRLNMTRQNPFTTASPKQLQKLKESFIKTMNESIAIDGQFEEVNGAKE